MEDPMNSPQNDPADINNSVDSSIQNLMPLTHVAKNHPPSAIIGDASATAPLPLMNSSPPKNDLFACGGLYKSISLCLPFKRIRRLDDINEPNLTSSSMSLTRIPHAGTSFRHTPPVTIKTELPNSSASSSIPGSRVSIETVILHLKSDSSDKDDFVVLFKSPEVNPNSHSSGTEIDVAVNVPEDTSTLCRNNETTDPSTSDVPRFLGITLSDNYTFTYPIPECLVEELIVVTTDYWCISDGCMLGSNSCAIAMKFFVRKFKRRKKERKKKEEEYKSQRMNAEKLLQPD
uniref:Uncharacterized protein n=1 Tax=Cucumis melo TaxID=3656 RepID=A0A9I9EDF9_CUCME